MKGVRSYGKRRMSLRELGRKRRRQKKPVEVTIKGGDYKPGLKRIIGRKHRSNLTDRIMRKFFPVTEINEVFRAGYNSAEEAFPAGATFPAKLGCDGLQYVTPPEEIMTVSKVLSFFQKMPDTVAVDNSKGMQSDIPTTTNVNFTGQQRIRINGIYFNRKFVSMTNTTSEFEVIVCTPRFKFSDGLTTELHGDPVAWWQQANDYAALSVNTNTPVVTGDPLRNGSPLSINIHTIGDRPYLGAAAKWFNKYWKIVDKKKFVLQPGQTQSYTYYDRRRKYVDRYDCQAFEYLPGITLEMFVIAKGQVVNGNSLPEKTVADASTADVAWSQIVNRKIWYEYVSSGRPIKWTNTATFGTSLDLMTSDQNCISTVQGGPQVFSFAGGS